MNTINYWLLVCLFCLGTVSVIAQAGNKKRKASKQMTVSYKPRIINTTDLGADPDDEQSMVRQLVSADDFDIEGLIVATGCWKKTQSNTAMLDKMVEAYGQAYPNLKVHAAGFPTPAYLKSISVMGQKGYGMSDVGTGKDSPGSDLIIKAADKDDPRPLWVMGWGGMNTIAQAIWKVRKTRSPAELNKFLSKLRLFDVLGQDDAGAWIAKNFPEVFYIRAQGVYGWQPPKNGTYQREDIQSHGALGAVYPDTKWATEGDSPAFMHVFPNGLNNPEKIDQGGWGGRFSLDKKAGIRSMSEVAKINKDAEPQFDPYYMYGNTPEAGKAISRWSEGYNNDFAARMDWSISPNYKDANHHPVAVLNGDRTKQVLEMKAKAGSTVTLNAAGSSDPDGNTLSYKWSFYDEPSSYDGVVSIQNATSATAQLEVPKEAVGKSLHIILEVWDNGAPRLVAYRRMIVNVQPTNRTVVSIKDNRFYINNELTYKNRYWQGNKIEGLLFNSRMVQGIFDDLNPATRENFRYPDTKKWDADRNTAEFIAAMPSWKEHGLLSFTLNLQGGSPLGYGNHGWINTTFDSSGNLREAYMSRLEKILNKADELAMVVILGYFYFGQDEQLQDEQAVINAVDKMTGWILEKGYKNLLIEINNECNIQYNHPILQPQRVAELIKRVQKMSNRKLLVSTSYGGNALPSPEIITTADFVLLHGNGIKNPERIKELVEQVRKSRGYTPKPILYNEDDHFDFDKEAYNLKSAVQAYASWGYFDYRMKDEGYDAGFQSVPVNWQISSPRKKQFFEKVKEITGY